MADQQQLDLLRQGVDVWNAWRKQHPDIPLNLSGADLRSANLSEADLSRANLSRANLSEADLSRANLSRANLSRAIFFSRNYVPRAFGGTLVIPNGADLSGAILRGAKVTDEQLAKAASLAGATRTDGSIYP